MVDRYDSLTPPLLIASLRSMPRRFTEALELAAPKPAAEVIEHAAADIGAMLTQLELLDEAIHTTADHAADLLPAAVDGAVLDRAIAAEPDRPALVSATATIAAIEAVTGRLADRLERLGAHDWNREARSPTTTYTVTELARGGVRVAAERLRATERSIANLRDSAD